MRRSVRIALRLVLLLVFAVLAVPGYFIVRGVFLLTAQLRCGNPHQRVEPKQSAGRLSC